MEWLKRLIGMKTSPAVENSRGRNDVCWCGSGVKYKRCHMAPDQARLRARTRTRCATS